MPNYLTRVELHNAQPGDYERLHREMLARKFGKEVQSVDGRKYALPTAMYVSRSDALSSAQVRDLAREASDSTGRTAWIVTANYNDLAWILNESGS